MPIIDMPHPTQEHEPHAAKPHFSQPFITPRGCLVAAFVFFCVMVTLGSMPGKAEAASALVPDKLLHFLAYAIMSVLVYAGLGGSRGSRALRTLLVIAALGGVDEAIQELLPYRQANLLDWKFDMLAALLCVSLMTLAHPFRVAAGRRRTDESIKH